MTTAVTALAEAWASIDGKLDLFRQDEKGYLPKTAGYYAGYMAEAQELIKRLRARGFDIVATTTTERAGQDG